jgi:hypothetical protein
VGTRAHGGAHDGRLRARDGARRSGTAAGAGLAHLRPDPAAHARDLLAAPAWNDPTVRSRLAGF